MKKRSTTALAIMLLLTISIQSYAYLYTFPNHTQDTIAIAIQFIGINEPLYKHLIHSHTVEIFGEDNGGVPEIKSGYCLRHIYYAKNPTVLQRKNKFENTPWREIQTTWISLKKYNKIIEQIHNKKPIDFSDIKSVHLTHPQTMCQDRRFEIVEDNNGKIYLISPVKE